MLFYLYNLFLYLLCLYLNVATLNNSQNTILYVDVKIILTFGSRLHTIKFTTNNV